MLRRILPIDFAVYLIVRALICLVQTASLETCQAWSRGGALLAWRVLRLRRRVIDENLRLAYPEATPSQRSAIALGMWRHLLLMIAEIAHAPRKLHRTNWREHSSTPLLQDVVRRLLDDRPLVVLTGHLGNFELGGFILGLHGFPTYTVARRLDNKHLDRWVNRFRGATGQYMVEKTGARGAIVQALDQFRTLVLLGDQYAGDKAVWTDFFGKPASTHKAVAMFTLTAEAPTMVAGVLRRGAPLHFEMRVADVADPRDADFLLATPKSLIAWYSQNLEALIRSAPEQYWWVHRRWKGNPQRRRQSRRAA